MPQRNTVKQFAPDQMYHLYNRGVEKRNIFLDERDYAVFLSYLKYALSPKDEKKESINKLLISDAQQFNLRRLDLADRIDLVAFCLMPNHFHLLAYQHDAEAITSLMRSIATGYSMYFNKRYNRTGTLFQGRYKACLIDKESYWLHISRYIHLNPADISEDYRTYPYSSYQAYSKKSEIKWLKTGLVMECFDGLEEYEDFVATYLNRREELKEIDKLMAR